MAEAPYIAQVGALVGDPARANILTALMSGQALTAKELALIAGVTPQTASGHLNKLVDGGLLTLAVQGRHRYFRLASVEVAGMIESLMNVAVTSAPRYRPRSIRDDDLANARMCYSHLAGRLGVMLADRLEALGYLVADDDNAALTTNGRQFLAQFGLVLPMRSDRTLCRLCLDWSERRRHIGGLVGAALAQRCTALGWIERAKEGRSVWVTSAGVKGFADTFGLCWAGARDDSVPDFQRQA